MFSTWNTLPGALQENQENVVSIGAAYNACTYKSLTGGKQIPRKHSMTFIFLSR